MAKVVGSNPIQLIFLWYFLQDSGEGGSIEYTVLIKSKLGKKLIGTRHLRHISALKDQREITFPVVLLLFSKSCDRFSRLFSANQRLKHSIILFLLKLESSSKQYLNFT